jgi:ribonuclease P protein component
VKPANTLAKEERLTRKKLIDELFAKGRSIKTPALLVIWHPAVLPVELPAQVLFTVSKRNFKRAHDRNRIKRLMREAYRVQKHKMLESLSSKGGQYALLFIFTGRQLPDCAYVHGRMQELLKRIPSAVASAKADTEPRKNEE